MTPEEVYELELIKSEYREKLHCLTPEESYRILHLCRLHLKMRDPGTMIQFMRCLARRIDDICAEKGLGTHLLAPKAGVAGR